MQKNNIRILILSEVFYPEIGSGSNRITNLMILLKDRGYKVDIITSEPKYPNRELYKSNLDYRDEEKEKKIQLESKVVRIEGSKLKPTANFFNRLYLYLIFFIKGIGAILCSREKYDIVIATMPSSFMGILGIIGKFKFKSKLILDIRDLWPECIKNIGLFRKNKYALKLAYKMEDFILKFSNYIVINSNGYRPYLEKKGYGKRLEFIPNSLQKSELENFRMLMKETPKNEKFTVTYAGMIGLPQNIRSLVKAANDLKGNKEIEFKIIGEGIQKEKVKELIEYYKLDNVTLLDAMPKKDAIKEVAKSHVAIVHLRADSAFDLVIPGKIIDYMGLGIPIIGGIDGYTASIIMKSKAGVVVKPDDHVNMAKEIMRIFDDSKLRESYIINGEKYCKDNFLWDKNIERYEEIIQEVLGGTNSEKESVHVCMESL